MITDNCFRAKTKVRVEAMRLYFAYGSNMWNTQMKKRCPHSKKIGIARLPGHRWIISARGYANIVESVEDEVEGILFEISQSDEKSLDKCEGVASGSYRKAELSVLHGENEKAALVYIDPITTEGTPKSEYIQRINAGLADAKLSDGYVIRYVRKFIPA
jgi:gamma-glutamylcyclotransferase